MAGNENKLTTGTGNITVDKINEKPDMDIAELTNVSFLQQINQ